MDIFVITALAIFSIYGVVWLQQRKIAQTRVNYINRYHFSSGLKTKLAKKRPELTEEQLTTVLQGLRDYFYICHRAKRKNVAMPSQVVDDAWHEFIIFTKSYKTFCQKAFGRFLHHTPSEAMTSQKSAQEGIRRAWRLACDKENISPKAPEKLPLIFAIDAMLGINDGFHYSLNCDHQNAAKPIGPQSYCASHIGCSSGCSGDYGGNDTGGGSSCSGSASSCSSGCGGD